MKSIKTLLQENDFSNDYEYFDYILESRANGQYTQAKEFFKALPNDSKAAFISYCIDEKMPYQALDVIKIFYQNEK